MILSFDEIGKILVIKVKCSYLCAPDIMSLEQEINRVSRWGGGCVIIDILSVEQISYSGVAALIELRSVLRRQVEIFVVCLDKQFATEEKMKLKSLLRSFSSVEVALKDEYLKQVTLCGVKAVILCNDLEDYSFSSLFPSKCSSLLDCVGEPLIARVVNNLTKYGIRDFILNPGASSQEVQYCVPHSSRKSMTFLNEGGNLSSKGWTSQNLGSGGALINICQVLNAFQEDFVVTSGNVFFNIDFVDALQRHKQIKADVTIIGNENEIAVEGSSKKIQLIARNVDSVPTVSTFQKYTSGKAIAYVFSPRSLKECNLTASADIESDLIPHIVSQGGKVQFLTAKESYRPTDSPLQYYNFLRLALSKLLPWFELDGLININETWACKTSKISASSSFLGTNYLADHSIVGAEAILEDCCVMEGGRISQNATIKRSLIMPGAVVRPGKQFSNVVVFKNGVYPMTSQILWNQGQRQKEGNISYTETGGQILQKKWQFVLP